MKPPLSVVPATPSAAISSLAQQAPSTASDAAPATFEDLVHRHAVELFRFAYWKVRDRALAEDLVQESFTRAWKSREALRDPGAARSWLYTILRREIARGLERPQPDFVDASELESLIADAGGGPAETVEMTDLLAALPDAYREPLLLQVLGGFSCAEIGVIMGVSEGAIMQRVSRARSALRLLCTEGSQRQERKA